MPDCPRTRSSSVAISAALQPDSASSAPAERQHPDAQRGRPAVHQVDAVEIPAARTAACADWIGARQAAGQQHRHHFVGLAPGVPEHPDELRRRRLRRGRQVAGDPKPPVELLRLELHPVPEGLVAEDHLQRDERDVVPIEHASARSAELSVTTATGPALRVGQPPVLRPHVVGLGGLDPAPAGCIGKDGLRGVGVHMDLEDIATSRRPRPSRRSACIAARTSLAGGKLLPRTSTSVQNWKSRSAATSTSAAGTSTRRRGPVVGVGQREDRVTLDEADHALEHPDEALAARVHDAGLLEDRHQLGRVGQGDLAFREQPPHELADVAGVGRGPLRGGRRPRGRR